MRSPAIGILLLSVWIAVPARAAPTTFTEHETEMLRSALQKEADPQRRAAIADSLERLRALPPIGAQRVVVVNIPSFRLTLWDGPRRVGQWKVIVGKVSTKTPQFTARIVSATVNPWWDVPPSIVRESVGALFRRSPREAARRGYVRSGGAIRQRPGPGNALGLLKFNLPNPYRVGLHDTPTKKLFDEDVRTFSHGCIRVQEIDRLAAELFAGSGERDRVKQLIAKGRTVTVPLSSPVPIIVGYFLAESDGEGVAVFDDVYHLAGRSAAASVNALPLAEQGIR